MWHVDFLVIGSGLAGLNAALRLAEHGDVWVLTKRQVQDSATAWAQGGIAGVLDDDVGHMGHGDLSAAPTIPSESTADSFDAHVQDTLDAGAGLCDEAVVRSIVSDAPRAIARLSALGVQFDQEDGVYHRTREGGHSARRILHAQDITGREIMRALQTRAEQHPRIRFLADHIAVDLITTRKLGLKGPDRCVGAYVLDSRHGNVRTLRAHATLLATGGAGKVYLYTSNPDIATGDGVAMAFRAGAGISNMEFFQFHPTCLYHPHAKSFLISEALRGEGGILRRRDGTAFMRDVHPLADLAPRDVVARAIDQEMKRWGDDNVFLDMTALDASFLINRFPNIHAACLTFGIDMTKTPIPVVPAAHYMCGGVQTDLQGRTDLAGLWAAGETACTGLHGANRLASNSLLEAAVMSERAADDMVVFERTADTTHYNVPLWDPGCAVDADEMVVVSHNWDELRRAMWSYVGIVRSDRRLERAADRIAMLEAEIHEYYWGFKLTHDLIELRNLCTVARLIVACARHRRESRGLHFNRNIPQPILAQAKASTLHCGPQNTIIWDGPASL